METDIKKLFNYPQNKNVMFTSAIKRKNVDSGKLSKRLFPKAKKANGCFEKQIKLIMIMQLILKIILQLTVILLLLMIYVRTANTWVRLCRY